jgi:hypothetical protein
LALARPKAPPDRPEKGERNMARRPAPTKAHPESKPGDDLIARLAGAPAPPILSDDELARLRAHLKTPLRLSAMKDKAERDRWRTLREVLNYNDELRADARGTPAPTPTVSVSPDLLDRLQRAAAAVDPGAIDRAAERAAEKIARVFGAGDNGDAKPKALPAGGDESAGPALTVNQSRVLQTMARFDASRLLSSKMIAEEMDATVRLSEETVRQCVGKLIEANLAERPEGDRSGARLTTAGRKLAGKIAD